MVEECIKQFTSTSIPFKRIKNRVYLKNARLEKVCFLDRYPDLFGCFLGEIKNDTFSPSFNFLDWLAERSHEKIVVNNRGEIDFLYGKHLRKRHVDHIYGNQTADVLKLVQNEQDENIGYGLFIGVSEERAQVLRHILDRGVFI